jgi:hypothetical protein
LLFFRPPDSFSDTFSCSDAKEAFRCKWVDCPSPQGPRTPAELYKHLRTMHIVPPGADASSEPDSATQPCRWASCSYTPQFALTPSTARADLSLHVRVHIPPEPAAPGVGAGGDKPVSEGAGGDGGADDDAAAAAVRIQKLVTQTEADEEGGRMPAGPAFVAALTLRTLARCVAEHIKPPRSGGGGDLSMGDGDGMDLDVDEERRIGWDILLSGGGVADAERQAAEAAQRQKSLQRAKAGLISHEEELVKVGTLNEALTSYMAECLEAVAKVREELAPKHRLVQKAETGADALA